MKVTLLKIEMHEGTDWGTLQINNFTKTYFRFEILNGKPVLDTTFFADAIKDPEKKHRDLNKDSDMYKSVQQLLEDNFRAIPRRGATK